MEVFEIVRSKQRDRGINIAELSRRTGIKYEALRVALDGGRGIAGSELIFLCRELELEISDFDAIKPTLTEAS